MVTNSRSLTSRRLTAARLDVESGGVSEGHTKLRSMRTCAPGRRCTLKRIAAGGTLNATPPIVIGSDGASSEIALGGRPEHAGDRRAVAARCTAMPTIIPTRRPASRRCRDAALIPARFPRRPSLLFPGIESLLSLWDPASINWLLTRLPRLLSAESLNYQSGMGSNDQIGLPYSSCRRRVCPSLPGCAGSDGVGGGDGRRSERRRHDRR